MQQFYQFQMTYRLHLIAWTCIHALVWLLVIIASHLQQSDYFTWIIAAACFVLGAQFEASRRYSQYRAQTSYEEYLSGYSQHELLSALKDELLDAASRKIALGIIPSHVIVEMKLQDA